MGRRTRPGRCCHSFGSVVLGRRLFRQDILNSDSKNILEFGKVDWQDLASRPIAGRVPDSNALATSRLSILWGNDEFVSALRGD